MLGVLLLVVALGGGAYVFRDRVVELIGAMPGAPTPTPTEWEATVRTEPPGLEISLDGIPLGDPGGTVRFPVEGPFGMLTAISGCRAAEHQLGPADAGQEVVLVMDPLQLSWHLDLGAKNMALTLNGKRVGKAPLDVNLDLCRENVVGLEAPGFRSGTAAIPAESTPLEARTLLAGLSLKEIPKGRLILPDHKMNVVYYLDGKRLAGSVRNIELTEGRHEVRLKNDSYWVDVRRTVEVVGGRETTANVKPPALATLVVQAFPANCAVHLKRPGGKWRYLDDTPMRRKIAVGKYELRVTLKPTGATRLQEFELAAGANPPIRVAFGRDR